MGNLILWLSSSVAVLVLQVLLPGILLCLMFDRLRRLSLVDAYLVGWLWNVVLGLLITPFWSNTASVSIGVKIGMIILVVAFLLTQLTKKFRLEPGAVTALLRRSLTKLHFVIMAATVLLFVSFVSTHNVGFDDTANLDYILSVVKGEVYPEYRTIVGEWEAARYPMWGVVMGALVYDFPELSLFMYYVMATTILVAFILKVYEFVIESGTNTLAALTAVFLLVVILMVGSLDNYFNFGVYPLQQAKLLYIVGLLYLGFGWWYERNLSYLCLGIGLITAAAFYHLNVVLLHGGILAIASVVICIQVRKFRKWIIYTAILVLPLIFVAPSAFSPEHGFLQLPEEEEEVETEIEVVRVEPTFFEELLLKVKKVWNWITDGDRTYSYSVRAFSLEILLIPLLLILFVRFKFFYKFNTILIAVSCLLILQQAITVIPRQIVASFLRSGTVWMLFDILGSELDPGARGKILTDPYTGLYLELLGAEQVDEMGEENELLAFSPLFPIECKGQAVENLDAVAGDQLVLNGRYWGIRAVERWRGESRSEFDNFDELLNQSRDRANVQIIPEILKSGLKVAVDQIHIPILSEAVAADVYTGDRCQNNMISSSDQQTKIYRDAGLVALADIEQGEEIEFRFQGRGEVFRNLGQYVAQGNRDPLVTMNNKNAENFLEFTAQHDAEKVMLLFQTGLGHFSGLGVMNSIKTIR